jgi:hypothetical protein
MKIFTLTCMTFVIFSSCKSYQYLTLSARDQSINLENKFIRESDSFRVAYDFSGRNGPLVVHIYNKLAEPIEVDWRRSSLIIGDQPIPLSPSELKVNGEISRPSYSRSSSATIQAEIEQPVGLEFIPPRSVVKHSGRI